jgi:PKD repeat protein
MWLFGDSGNSSSTLENPTFTYSMGGTYVVRLLASGPTGQLGTSMKTITVTQVASVKSLYFVEYGNTKIRKLALDGSGTLSDVFDITGKGGVGLSFNPADSKIYFSDFEVAPEGKIWRMDLDGSNLQGLASGIDDPYGIALDTGAGKIYWVDNAGNVSRANLDGTSPEIPLVNIPGGQLRAIALDTKHSKFYFYEVNLENLYVADLTTGAATILLTGVYGYAIVVDTMNDKLYYEDQNSATLIRSNLDGTSPITIDANGTRIYGMAIDYTDNKLYWSGRDSGEITRANLDGTNPEILATGLLSPRGIFIKQ